MKALSISRLCFGSVLILALMVAWVAATPQRSLMNNVVGGACTEKCGEGANWACNDIAHGGYSWCERGFSQGKMCTVDEESTESCVIVGYPCLGGGGCEELYQVDCVQL